MADAKTLARPPAHCHADPALRGKHLALLFVGGKAQSEILRFAQNDSEGLRMTARQTCAKKTRQVLFNDSMIR
jgi:hypothetical protein